MRITLSSKRDRDEHHAQRIGAQPAHVQQVGHQPVQPALYQSLKTYRCDVLTPVLDSLLALYEKYIGRRFRAGAAGQADLSGDEHDLLDLLARPDGGEAPLPELAANPGLAGTLRIALRSARIMIQLALDPAEQPPLLRIVATA